MAKVPLTIYKKNLLELTYDFYLAFSVVTGENLKLSTEITDYNVENGEVIAVSANKKPAIITLRGYVGELVADKYGVAYKNGELHTKIDSITDKVSEYIDSSELPVNLIPPLSNYMALVVNTVRTVENTVLGYVNKFKKDFLNEKKERQQQVILDRIREIWSSKTPVIVKLLDYGTFTNMYIIEADFGKEKSENLTDMSITLKQVNIASTNLVDVDVMVYKDRMSKQIEAQKNNGVAKTEKRSWAKQIHDL